jgi:cytochrome c-type biogenesis protein CcmH/NrfG
MNNLTCAACGRENPAGARFCSQCGGALSISAAENCAACGGSVTNQDKFCPACGAVLKKEAGDYRRLPRSAPWVAMALVAAGLVFIFIFVTSQSRPPQTSAADGAMPGSSEPALPQLTEADIAKLPKDFSKLVEQGNHYFDHQQFHDAMVLYRKALEIDSGSLDVRTDYAASLNFLGDFNGAKAQLEKVLAQKPKHIVATFNMGVVHINLGRNAEAKKYWSQYLELDPTSPRAAEVKKMLAELK